MSALLARIAVTALMAGAATVSGAGQGWLTILFPKHGREIIVFYEDRDGNGCLSLNSPDPANRDLLTGATMVPK